MSQEDIVKAAREILAMVVENERVGETTTAMAEELIKIIDEQV